MIVGGYTLDLYCDVEVDDVCHRTVASYAYGFEQYTGETGEECRQQARRAGWKLDLRNGVAVCPTCVKAGRRP